MSSALDIHVERGYERNFRYHLNTCSPMIVYNYFDFSSTLYLCSWSRLLYLCFLHFQIQIYRLKSLQKVISILSSALSIHVESVNM